MKNKRALFFLSTAAIIIILDQILKLILSRTLELGQSIPLIKNLFHLTLIHNTGAGFGILKDHGSLLIWISIIAMGIITYYYDQIPKKDRLPQIAAGLLMGGIIGNLIDRLAHGFVIDFFDLMVWPAFNIADSAITIGVILLIIYLWKK